MSGGKRQQKKINRQNNNATKNLSANVPGSSKVVPAVTDAKSIDPEPFAWSADAIDHEYSGEWDWHLNPKEAKDVLDVLANLSLSTWAEVKAQMVNSKSKSHKKHHDQSVDSICKAARDRLDELQINVERVFRLRHGNMIRIWGYMDRAVFQIVWFDRNHRVCPTESE